MYCICIVCLLYVLYMHCLFVVCIVLCIVYLLYVLYMHCLFVVCIEYALFVCCMFCICIVCLLYVLYMHCLFVVCIVYALCSILRITFQVYILFDCFTMWCIAQIADIAWIKLKTTTLFHGNDFTSWISQKRVLWTNQFVKNVGSICSLFLEFLFDDITASSCKSLKIVTWKYNTFSTVKCF